MHGADNETRALPPCLNSFGCYGVHIKKVRNGLDARIFRTARGIF